MEIMQTLKPFESIWNFVLLLLGSVLKQANPV
ncbi:glycosyltransferase, family 2 [Lactiplantibacillus plantarum]|nr:glycosyltransferase, family 2 [Lactiplantibacillus plantarum]MCG0940350.1 glycosyltransferase, family 2 [Lactiplantibacillus plantarum]